jgi:hypothetical protein
VPRPSFDYAASLRELQVQSCCANSDGEKRRLARDWYDQVAQHCPHRANEAACVVAIAESRARANLEINMTDQSLNVGGSFQANQSAVGAGARVDISNSNAYANWVNGSSGVNAQFKQPLMDAQKALAESTIDAELKKHLLEYLGKITEELEKPEPRHSFIQTFWNGLKIAAEQVKPVAELGLVLTRAGLLVLAGQTL